MTWLYYIATALLAALITLGALHRLEVDLPGPLSWLAAVSWSLAAGVAGLIAGLWLRGSGDEGTDGGKAKLSTDVPEPEPETAADDAEAVTDAATEDEQNPSASEVADDINAITSEVNQ